MKTEMQHFTDAQEIQHFAVVKVNPNDNVYGIAWGNVVREYLKTAYTMNETQMDVISDGITYKVLKRPDVTAFYDSDGNTLFDVENKRLEREYGYVMEEERRNAGECDADKEDTELGDTSEDVSTDDEGQEVEDPVTPMGKATADIEKADLDAAVTDNAESKNFPGSAKDAAKKKLEKELKDANNSAFAESVIGYLLKRCEEDEGLAQDVRQEHKTWKKCFDYIYAQAKKQSKGNCTAVCDDVVYEWAEDYYHKDDKAEEEKKAKKEAEDKVKREKAAAERKAAVKGKPEKSSAPAAVKEQKAEEPKEQAKPKKNGSGIEGQMDIFSLMGM